MKVLPVYFSEENKDNLLTEISDLQPYNNGCFDVPFTCKWIDDVR